MKRFQIIFTLVFYLLVLTLSLSLLLVQVVVADNNETSVGNVGDGNGTTTADGDDDDDSSLLEEKVKEKLYRVTDEGKVIVGDYIIVFNKTLVEEIRDAIATIRGNGTTTDDDGITISKEFGAIKQAKIQLLQGYGNGTTDDEKRLSLLKRFLESDLVVTIEEDQKTKLLQDNSTSNTTGLNALNQEFPPWGLDRIDQVNNSLNNQYHSDTYGEDVTAYVIDTGVLPTHVEFEGRAVCAFSAIDKEDCTDGNGHGTHCSGTIGGKTYGVAKKVNIVGIKVLSNEGSGSNSAVMDGINYVLLEILRNPEKKVVINMSLGGWASPALDDAVEQLIDAGAFVGVAAGNSNIDACLSSPSRVRKAITVAASDKNDKRAEFSNFGSCVDIFGPGVDITSSWYTSDTATNTISGTSMATPHIVGVAALYFSSSPRSTAEDVADKMINDGIKNVITDPKDSPNIMVNTEMLFTTTPASPPSSPFQTNISLLVLSIHALISSLLLF